MKHRTKFLLAGLFVIIGIITPPALGQVTFEEIYDNGPDSNRLNIVVFGDGYIAGQEDFFRLDVQSFIGDMFSTPPFYQYESYFNVYAIFVPSNEAGSDHPSSGIYRDTYFSSTYDSYGITRLITIPPNDYDSDYNHGEGRIFDLLATYKPDYDILILLVNDTQYGGSGGILAISSLNSSSSDVTMHELGHSFGGLADEYEDYTPGYSGYESPNTTAETVRELIKWTDWIEPSTPIPTPENTSYIGIVGLFEGACYETYGWYRPMFFCKMRETTRQFCSVCREELVKAEYAMLSPIDSVSPVQSTLELLPTETMTFTAQPLVPPGHELGVQWYLDGTPIVGATATDYELDGAVLSNPSYVLEARVFDTTSLVKNDPAGLLTDAWSWTVSPVYICGDVYPDDLVNLLDILYLIDYKYGVPTGPAPDPYALGDVDSDGTINLIDILYIIDFVYGTPPGPAPSCTF